MKQYLELVQDILDNGVQKGDRTGTGTVSVFGRQMRFDLSNKKLPVVTTKKIHLNSIIHELIWMIVRGDTNTRYLQNNKVTIWDEWADEHGDLGPVYGKQFRSWIGTDGKVYDQIQKVIDTLMTNPDSRRMIVSLWKVDELKDMALEPCHMMHQYYVADGKLSCQVYIRSNDIALGAPFNITFYALLTHIIANITGLKTGELVYTIGDAHIYSNHIDGLKEQLAREPLTQTSKVHLGYWKDVDGVREFTESRLLDINEVTRDNIHITGYDYITPHIKFDIAV